MTTPQLAANDPLHGIIVTDVFRFTDARENGVVLGIEADAERHRFVFASNVASKVVAGLIDGLADLGDSLAQSLQKVMREEK